MEELSKDWFELKDHRKRLFAKAVWIPVYGVIRPIKKNTFPNLGHIEETIAVYSAVVPTEYKDEVEKMEWSSFSYDGTAPFLDDEGKYHEAGSLLGWGNKDLGFRLVLTQYINSDHPRDVRIHQDFIYAYGLIEEGDKWLKPLDGYEEVIRVKRRENGVPEFIEVRAEYLRDYLAARNSLLRLHYYRERQAILADNPNFDWPEDNQLSKELNDRCEVRCYAITEAGDIPDAGWAMFKSWRTDVDTEEDIPDFSAEDETTTDSTSIQGKVKGDKLHYRVIGEHWKAEWIEPAVKSVRMGYDEPEEDLFVSPDASGTKVNLETLNYEAVGKYLWFKPDLINSLLSCRGGHLGWYSEDTGYVSGSADGNVHFGVNRLGYVNAYARDVAILPLWERRIWVANNISPDGSVCAELLKAQMECNPADTKSPEYLINEAIKWFEEQFSDAYRLEPFNHHDELETLERNIYRFRAVDESGLRSLAKDIVKFTIERINKKSLVSALKLGKSDLGTLKLLENILASVTEMEWAKKHMAPLFGVYDLRGADAHLASSDIEGAYSRIKVDRTAPYSVQGAIMIRNVAVTIGVLGTQLKHRPQKPKSSAP